MNKSILDLRKKITKKPIKFAFFDLEAYSDKNSRFIVFMISFVSDKETLCITSIPDVPETVYSQNPVSHFLDYIIRFYPNYNIYAHNMGKFDGILLLKEISQNQLKKGINPILLANSIIYQIQLINNILIRDSFLLLPFSLEHLAEHFNLTKKKLNKETILYLTNENYFLNAEAKRDYCVNDSFVGYNIIQTFEAICISHFKINPLKFITISEFSFQYYLNSFSHLAKDIQMLSPDLYNDIRNCYHGGRIDFNYDFYSGHIYKYDVNSMYPFIMASFSFPIGLGKKMKFSNLESTFGFLTVKVFSPKNRIPVLPYLNEEQTLTYPTGVFTGSYFSEELKYAVKLGYKILKVYDYIKFEKKGGIFTEFVQKMYAERKNYPKKHPMSIILKLILNTLYGKMAQKNYNTYTKVIKDSKEILDSLSTQHYRIRDTFVILKEARITGRALKYPINIAAAITSYARIYLHETIKTAEDSNFIYCDTDSIITAEKLDENLIDPNTLGMWKFEGKFSKIIIIGAKSYILIGKDDVILEHKLKGITHAARNSPILEHDAKTTKYTQTIFDRHLSKMEIYLVEQIKVSKNTTHLKRRLSSNNNLIPFNIENN